MYRAAQFQVWLVRNINMCLPCRQLPLGLAISMNMHYYHETTAYVIGFYDISFLIIDVEIDIRDT